MKQWNRWQDWLKVAVGLLVIASPWILGASASNAILWNSLIVGGLLALAGLWALYQPMEALPEWASVVLGIWLVISPWILGFSATTSAVWYDVIAGAVVAIVAVWTERIVVGMRATHA